MGCITLEHLDKNFPFKIRVNENYDESKKSGVSNHYFLKDHLGNIRVTFKDNNGVAEVVSAKDYYPFGSVMRSMQAIPDEQDKWKYQGKERDLETGYDYFEHRYYDSSVPRFLQVDPKAEDYPSMNGYTAMGNNPIRVIDPDGKEIYILYNESYTDKKGNKRIRQRRVLYTGSKMKHKNKSVMKMIGVINNIASTKTGAPLVSTLMKDKRSFGFLFRKIKNKPKHITFGRTSFSGITKNKKNEYKFKASNAVIDNDDISNSKGLRTLEETTAHEMQHMVDGINNFTKEYKHITKTGGRGYHKIPVKIGKKVRKELKSKNIVNKGVKK